MYLGGRFIFNQEIGDKKILYSQCDIYFSYLVLTDKPSHASAEVLAKNLTALS